MKDFTASVAFPRLALAALRTAPATMLDAPAGANFYDYDGAGRLTNHAVHGRTRAFTYDFTGRMISLTDTNGSVFAYEFDAEGNRQSQALNDCLDTRFVHDGPDVLLDLNPANAVAYAWIDGPGIDQPIERLLYIDGVSRARRVFHSDALGSVAALTDPGGHVTQTYAYSAFGTLRSSSGPDLNRVTYTAREHLGDSQGWMYYRHRVYDCPNGRFSTMDPLKFINGANRYNYVESNPLTRVDPLGLRWLGGADNGIQVGRKGTCVSDEPGELGEWLEEHVPAMETMGFIHDGLVGGLTSIGLPDALVNIPTMPACYITAVAVETVKTPMYIYDWIVGLFKDDKECECTE